ncbi:hypothetical protein BpHYR1_028013 [Brachionus plicatilis]|uniref:Uncharacterized protein n=1 Tax=Brachionus plicatilis TaxID=10195 RepID=A0A3M7RKZ9_BRAPC|nr:hypothetical protein BpHYR1_028013 [Brachionus plicatilis]
MARFLYYQNTFHLNDHSFILLINEKILNFRSIWSCSSFTIECTKRSKFWFYIILGKMNFDFNWINR